MSHFKAFLSFILPWVCFAGFVQIRDTPEQNKGADLLRSADEILKEVSAIRGLSIKYLVKKGIKSKPEIRKYVIKRLHEEYPPEQLSAEQKALSKLGLIPKSFDLEATLLDLYEEQIAGYYDPHEKIFFIADWLPLEIQKPTMAHELTHALQDQHFDLSAFLSRVKNNDDMTLARLALIEGEGFAVMLDYMLRPQGLSFTTLPDLASIMASQKGMLEQFKVFSTVPDYLKQVLMFPYIYGTSFLQAYRKKHSWAELSKVYSELPKSTEQIIHPEKYIEKRDDPIRVQINYDPRMVMGWKEIYTDVLGEFSTYLLIKQFSNETLARTASEGWGGDQIKLFENPTNNKLFFILSSVWDSEKDAKEFFEAYKQVIENKYKQKETVEAKAGKSFFWETEEDAVYLEVSKLKVLVIEGAPKDLIRKLRRV